MEDRGTISNGPVSWLDGHVYCPFFALDASPSANAFEMAYDAPRVEGSGVRAAVLLFDANASRLQIAFASSGWRLERGYGRAPANVYEYAGIHDEPGHVDSALENTGLLPAAKLVGFRIFRRGPSVPGELAAAGGTLRVDAGYRAERTDGSGNTWYPAELHLAPDHPPQSFVETPRAVDRRNLDPAAPDFLFERDLACECDLDFQLEVPPGEYEVTFYFVESCMECTHIAADGVIDGGDPRHTLRLRVEDQGMRFVPADAAAGPDSDGKGAYDVASRVSLAATVSEGTLDIAVERDRGPAVLSGLTIRRRR
jgi:hypothetical protein